jgi:hypothetical protein
VKLSDCKLVFVAVGLIGVLLFASPAIEMVLSFPSGEQFSELYLLGPGHMAEDYPFNVVAGQNYSVYVGVGNHMGSLAYYVLYVKFGNRNEPLPNVTLGVPSSLQSLYECRAVLEDGKSWEAPLMFSFSEVSFSGNRCRIGALHINGVVFNVGKEGLWDLDNRGFYYQLFVELWMYSATSNTCEFNDRFVGLQLNMTSSPQLAV